MVNERMFLDAGSWTWVCARGWTRRKLFADAVRAESPQHTSQQLVRALDSVRAPEATTTGPQNWAASSRLELPVLQVVDRLFGNMVAHGDGDLDHSAIVREVGRRNGSRIA